MAEPTAKTMLGEISQGHLECPICFCRFRDPKILDCLHSFCLNCLYEMMNKQKPKTDEITCPVCRKVTPVPATGLRDLLDCFFISSLVDEVNKQEKSLAAQAMTTPTCDECEEELEAVSRCLDCDENLCLMCKVAHERSKHTKKHQFMKVESPNQVSPADLGKKDSPKCQKHGNQEMHFYCDTCDMLTCGTCATVDHRSAEHKLSEIADAIKYFREDVENILQQFDKSKGEFKAADESVDHARNRLKIMVDRACSDISAKEEEEIAKIRTKSRLLKEKVTQIGKERDEKYETVKTNNKNKIEQAEKAVAAVTDLMQRADDFELLNLKPKVVHNLEFQKGLKFERAKHVMSFIGVKCHDIVPAKDLGKILHEEKWQLKNEFGKQGGGDGEFKKAQSVGCFSNGDISVVDTNRKRVSIFTSTGRYKTTFTQSNEDLRKLNDPSGNTVTYDDIHLVTDGENVKVFNTNRELIRHFKPSQDDAQWQPKSVLSRIAVDKKKRLAVADVGRNAIFVNKLDGSLISVIPTNIAPEDIAISNKEHIFVTGHSSSRLLSVDFTGNTLFDISTSSNGKLVKPSGVCCDEAGDIYVAVDCTTEEVGNGELHHYDPQGVYIGCIAQKLFWPFSMTFSPGGEIVVADQHSIKIFQRV